MILNYIPYAIMVLQKCSLVISINYNKANDFKYNLCLIHVISFLGYITQVFFDAHYSRMQSSGTKHFIYLCF